MEERWVRKQWRRKEKRRSCRKRRRRKQRSRKKMGDEEAKDVGDGSGGGRRDIGGEGRHVHGIGCGSTGGEG